MPSAVPSLRLAEVGEKVPGLKGLAFALGTERGDCPKTPASSGLDTHPHLPVATAFLDTVVPFEAKLWRVCHKWSGMI